MLKVDNWSEARDLLRTWRENNERKSADVLYLWNAFLELNIKKVTNEKHLILEQVCIAALDCNRIDLANYCVKMLLMEFPKSLRVKKYVAMILEAQERYDEALQKLDNIIKEDETNAAPRKRKVAVLKAQGRNAEAIKELTEYLKFFMADIEGWQELSELYINELDFGKAAFCIEELILHNPHNHLLHQRYADIKYTQGGYDNMELARAYYCQALKLNPNNLRALYGVYLACNNIAGSQRCTAQKKKEAIKLADWAMSEINGKYEKYGKNKDKDIVGRLSALQLN